MSALIIVLFKSVLFYSCFIVELSPSQNAGSTGFKLPKNRIKPVGADILRAIQGLSHGLRSYLPNTCQT